MGFVSGCRIVLWILAGVLTLFAVILTAAALFTPYWTTADINRPAQQHTHGLWEDCVMDRSARQAAKGTAPTWTCAYKEFSSHYDDLPYFGNNGFQTSSSSNNQPLLANKSGHHHGESWILSVLCLIVTAALFGLISLCCSCCSGCWKGCAIIWSVFTFLAALLSMIAVIIFVRNANDPKNKFFLVGTETAEQRIGYSFWLAVGGCIMFFIATIFSVLTTVLIFTHARQYTDKVHQTTWPKPTKNTVI